MTLRASYSWEMSLNIGPEASFDDKQNWKFYEGGQGK
jgi:hypothetical protein